MRIPSSLPRTSLWAAASLVLLGACGSDTANTEDVTETANVAPENEAAVQLADVNPCGGLTAADATAILSLSAAELEQEAGRMTMEGAPSNAYTCSYTARTDWTVSLAFALYVEPSAKAAAAQIEEGRQSMGAVSEVESLPGVGDEAYWFPGKMLERTLARKGAVWIDVLMPSDKDRQRQVAEAALRGV